MCAGVVPQQPPTMRAPAASNRGTMAARYSGLAAYTNWPSIRWGSPALGMIERVPESAPTAIASSASAQASGPPPQLTPTTSAPAASSAATANPGVRPVRELELLAEGQLGDDREVRRAARLLDGEQEVGQDRERLEDEQVDPALEEAVELFADGRPDRVVGQMDELAGRRSERSDRARHPGVPPGHVACLAGELRAAPVERGRPIAHPVSGEAEPVGPERGRLDQLGAGVQVLPVDRADQLGPGRDQLVEVGPLRDAPREQERAHRPVGQ